MQRGNERLSDARIRAWLAKGKTRKLADGGGLHLVRLPSGRATWRCKYNLRVKGALVPRTFSIGPYDQQALGLKQARAERDRVKAWLREGRDPVLERRLAKDDQGTADQTSFGHIALEWLERRKARKNWSAVHYEKTKQALERDILPALGDLPVQRITPRMVADAFAPVLARGVYETASKLLQNVTRIFARAKALHLITANPAQDLREELIPERSGEKHHPALLTLSDLGQVLRDFTQAPYTPQLRMLNRLIAFTAVRHQNALGARWEQFDLDGTEPVWTIPRIGMKGTQLQREAKADFKVPLSPTIAAELRRWKHATTGTSYVFPSATAKRAGKPLTVEALSKAYRSLGYGDRHTPHGWRSSFSTIAKESALFDEAAVELSLDHVYGSKVQRAYDHGARWEQRVKLAYWWDACLTAAEHGTAPLSIVRTA